MGGRNLPYAYKVKYLESSGTQWILTNIFLATPKPTILDITFASIDGNYDKNVFGGDDARGFNLYFQGNYSLGFYLCGGFVLNNLNINAVVKNTVHIEIQNNAQGTFILNNASFTIPQKNITQSTSPFNLFTQYSGTYRCSKIRIYKCSIVIEDNKVLDFIPVVDKQGVPAMYDKVSSQLLYNQGTGQFIAGPRVRGGGNNN